MNLPHLLALAESAHESWSIVRLERIGKEQAAYIAALHPETAKALIRVAMAAKDAVDESIGDDAALVKRLDLLAAAILDLEQLP